VATNAKQIIRFCTGDDGTRIAYAESGEGPPLVKAANWLTHLEFDWNSPVWRHWLDELSRRHRLIRYDERGCGLSDWNVADQSFEAWLRDLEMVVDANGLERFALLGISQGAAVAIAYAVRHPERVTHLVLHGGYARGRRMRAGFGRRAKAADMLVKMVELGWGQENPAFRQFFTSHFIPGATLEQQQWFNELERISTSPANAVRFMEILSDIDVQEPAARGDLPDAVLHPTRDAAVHFEEGRLMAGRSRARDSCRSKAPTTCCSSRAGVAALRRGSGGVPAGSDRQQRQLRRLTRRENELVELIAQGRDNAQIAASLGVAEKTVRNHITHIFAKLEVENRSQAIVLARNAGFGRA
jgi:pimeloyl-ACP methyl ester carboxylesterase